MKIPKIKLPSRAKLKEAAKSLKKAMPTILTVASVTANVVAVGLYIDRTFDAAAEIEEMREQGYEKKDIAKKIAPKYVLPTIIFIGAQICVIECNILNKRQQMALSAALFSADYRLRQYKEKVKQEYGENADDHVEDEIAKDIYKSKYDNFYIRPISASSKSNTEFADYSGLVGNQDDGTSRFIAPEGTVLFYDPYRNSGKEDGYFETTMIQVKQAMYHFNRNFVQRGYAYLNEFYEFIGIPATNFGDFAFWDMSEHQIFWIDISIREMPIDETLTAYVIDYDFAPMVSSQYDGPTSCLIADDMFAV